MKKKNTEIQPDEPHDLDAFNSYADLGDWNAIQPDEPHDLDAFTCWKPIPGIPLMECNPLPPKPKCYDPTHFCQSWCKCCEDNLVRRIKETEAKDIAALRISALQLISISTHNCVLGRRQ